jgi:predicted nucleic acid-binding protein
MRYLIDSCAWIEYLNGDNSGEKISEILEGNNEIFVLPLNIAEVISYLKRNNNSVEIGYNSIIKNSKLFQITPKLAREAGLLHADLKKKNSGFSLADAFMIVAAQDYLCKLVTTDTHFKGFKEVILIK